MKINTLPIFCGVALTALSTAGLSHWWSVRQFVAAVDSGLPVQSQPIQIKERSSAPNIKSEATHSQLAATTRKPTAQSAKEPAKQKFYEAMLTRMENLQNQNRDLLDQLAETNRDLMKLEFRVDTHSESFRPLPIAEAQPFTSLGPGLDGGPGVLPPRAEPVELPTFE